MQYPDKEYIFLTSLSHLLSQTRSEHEIASDLLFATVLSTFSAGGYIQSRPDIDFIDVYCGAFSDKPERDRAIRYGQSSTRLDAGGTSYDPQSQIYVYTLLSGMRVGLKSPQSALDEDIIEKGVVLCETSLSVLGNIRTFQHLYLVDELTGLPNMLALQRYLQVLDSDIEAPRPSVIMYVDINGFTSFNKTFGYAKGDEALRSIARSLKVLTGEYGKVYRFTGDEFCIVLNDQSTRGYEHIARRIQGVVHRADAGVQLTSTVGLSEYHGQTVREMLSEAGVSTAVVKKFFERRSRAREESVVPE